MLGGCEEFEESRPSCRRNASNSTRNASINTACSASWAACSATKAANSPYEGVDGGSDTGGANHDQTADASTDTPQVSRGSDWLLDDTLFKRSDKKVFGVAWHHDGAAKGPKPIGFGNCWVVAGIVVQLPFLSRPVCLPVLARLWRPRHTGKIAHARALAELLAARYPDRIVHVVRGAALPQV